MNFWITIIFIDLVFAAFLVLYFAVSDKYLPLLIISGILSVMLVPYLFLTKLIYRFSLTEDNILYMKSTVNFVLSSYTVDLKKAARIYKDDPLKSQSLIFEDTEGSIIGRFNPEMMGDKIYEYIDAVRYRNPHIQVDVSVINVQIPGSV